MKIHSFQGQSSIMTPGHPAVKFFDRLFIFGLFLLAGSLPYSKFLVSLSEIFMVIGWIGSGNIVEKVKKFFANKTALLLGSVFLLHLIGLLWTSDFQYGLEDIRKKIPLLLLPFLFAGTPALDNRIWKALMGAFVLSVLIGVLISLYYLLGFSTPAIVHPHQASRFISHIRFSHMICLSIFVILWFAKNEKHTLLRLCLALLSCGLFLYLLLLESAMGILCAAVAGIFFIYRELYNSKLRRGSIAFTVLLAIGAFFMVKYIMSAADQYKPRAEQHTEQMDELTSNGNPYTHLMENLRVENRNYVWRYVCEKELEDEWKKVSNLDIHKKDLAGNDLKYTLVRFLTSKGLRKDADGVKALDAKEIKAIESGIPNVNFMKLNLTSRLQKIMYEFHVYSLGSNPGGHSVIQRLEFWKTGHAIFKEHPWMGVGTGDVCTAFDHMYNELDSALKDEYRLRSHNQYLAIAVAFGLTGLIWFLFALLYPLSQTAHRSNYFYPLFMIIVLLSFIMEDTLESQMGVTFYAFFNALFLFLQPTHKESEVRSVQNDH